ncbi:hypothetical protein Lal_00017676 [Lupinus albus]|nr:hypothetical protein Lal_00017676 [Lupinus albus]
MTNQLCQKQPNKKIKVEKTKRNPIFSPRLSGTVVFLIQNCVPTLEHSIFETVLNQLCIIFGVLGSLIL